MPILKQIAGHGSCVRLQRYLEKSDRALARDLFNFDGVPDPDHNVEPDPVSRFDWTETMDKIRKEEGNDLPWKGKEARTFKHFVLSPLTHRRNGPPFAERTLPGMGAQVLPRLPRRDRLSRRQREPHPPCAHRREQHERGHGQEDAHRRPARAQPGAAGDGGEAGAQCSEQREAEAPHRIPAPLVERNRRPSEAADPAGDLSRRAERRAEKAGGYSWVADIRSRVNVAKNLARSEREFRRILGMMGVDMEDNSPHARRRDWIFSLSNAPARRVSGERLGASYGKAVLERRLVGAQAEHLPDASSRELLRLARKAVELKDLGELDSLSRALETCGRWGIASVDGIDRAIAAQRRRLGNGVPATRERAVLESLEALERARAFLTKNNALPLHDASRKVARGDGKGGWKSDPTTPSQSLQTQERELDTRGGRQR